MYSTRYAPAVLALLAIAALPTVMHSYLESTEVAGRSARAVPATLAGKIGTPTTRRAGWGADRFSSSDWIERRYAGPPAVTLFVGQSFDAKRLYHHPELALDYGHRYGPQTTVWLPARPGVPVHLLRGTGTDARRLAVYALRQGDEYVADPIRFQLRASLRLLIRPRQPMTLFFAAQDLDARGEAESSEAAALLLASLDAFEQQPVTRKYQRAW